MTEQDLHYIGSLQKAKGLKGDIKVSFEAFFIDYMEKHPISHLFIKQHKNFVPFFVEQLWLNPTATSVLKFEEVNNRGAAEKLQFAELFIEQSKIEAFIPEEEELGWDYLIGFTLYDANTQQRIGKIKDIYYLNMHELAAIDFNNEEVLIPLHEDMVTSINEDKKDIHIVIPDGLIQVFTEKAGPADDI